MRTAFIEQLIAEARQNPRIFLVVGDLGYSVVEPFAEEFPARFLNAGVAEQNMTGLAAGLASEGFHVFTYSIGNFPTLRCLEQIRNDVCYHHLPVSVVAVGAGLSYGNLGYSHHCVQDLGCLRGMPNLTLLSPADPGEARQCVTWLAKHPGPSYLRLGKAGEPVIHNHTLHFNEPLKIVDRVASLAIVGTGSILAEALAASDQLTHDGISCDVWSVTKLTGLEANAFRLLHNYERVLIVEEHIPAGGLGELLAASLPRRIRTRSLAIPSEFCSKVGSQAFLRRTAGIDAVGIRSSVISWLAEHGE